jgi:hypothetical protein
VAGGIGDRLGAGVDQATQPVTGAPQALSPWSTRRDILTFSMW